MAKEETASSKNVVTVKQAGPCKKKIHIQVTQENIKTALDERYGELGKDAQIPGFRKGRAPRRLLEKRFGKEVTEQIKLKILAQASESAIKDNKLDILGEPDIDYESIELPQTEPLKFDFEVEVQPEFDLPKLEEIPVKKAKLQVTDEQVDREIQQIRRWSGVWAPRGKQDKVQKQDQIIADVILKPEDAEEGRKLDNIEIYVRPNGFVDAVPVEKLDELLEGAGTADTRQITADVSETYFREEYRGKKVDIQIKIKEIKFLKPAELNENFLKKFQVENEQQLRERFRDSLQGRLEQQSRTQMAEQIQKYLLENTDFDLPLDVVADQVDMLIKRRYAELMRKGLPREQVEEQMQQLKTGSQQQAKEQVRTFFIMNKAAEKFGIEVSEEEVNGQIAALAMQRQQRPEKLREQMIRNGSLAQFKLQLRDEKCIAKLLESAKITEAGKAKTKKKKTTNRTIKEKKTKSSSSKTDAGSKKSPKKKSKNSVKKKSSG